jgi:hypothetical protein
MCTLVFSVSTKQYIPVHYAHFFRLEIHPCPCPTSTTNPYIRSQSPNAPPPTTNATAEPPRTRPQTPNPLAPPRPDPPNHLPNNQHLVVCAARFVQSPSRSPLHPSNHKSHLVSQPHSHTATQTPSYPCSLPEAAAELPRPLSELGGCRRGESAQSCKVLTRKRLQHAAESRCRPSASLLILQCRREGLHRTRGEVRNATCKKWGKDE